MSEPIVVPEQPEPGTEIEPPKNGSREPSDSTGFGLVNWLFDHINDRKPVFLCLYQEYAKEVKLSSTHKAINWILLVMATIGDLLLFAVYAAAIILVIVGITFIFVKGTGLLDYIHKPDQRINTQIIEKQELRQ